MANPQDTKPVQKDFLPFYVNGFSHDEIAKGAREENFSLGMLPEQDAFKKYTSKGGIYEGMPENTFHDFYGKAHASYDNFQTNQYNDRVAPYWEHDKPEVNGKESGVTGIVPDGYDRYGRQIATMDQVASKKGYYIDTDGKHIPYKDPDFLHKLWNIPTTVLSILDPPLAPLMQGDDPNKIMVLDQEGGSPVYRMAFADDPKVLRSQIVSSWGAQSMHENWMAALLKGVYNGLVPAIQSITGSVAEQTNELIDFVTTGKDSNSWLERKGRMFQNLAQRNKISVGLEGQQGFFDSFSSAAYSIGSLIPIVLLTRGVGGAAGAGLEGAGMAPGVAEAVGHSAGTFGVFAGLGLDSYVEVAKENHLDPADIAWQGMLVAGGMGAFGMVAGPAFLTKGLAWAEMKAGAKELINGKLEAAGLEKGVGFALQSPEEKLRVVKGINKSLTEFFEKHINATTKAGKVLASAHGMGTMMASMEIPDVGIQTLNDWRALAKNPNSKPGEGQFEKYDANKSFLYNILDRLPNKMLSSYVNGFMSGLLYTPVENIGRKALGMPGMFSKMPEMTNENIVASGKTQDVIKVGDKLKNDSYFGRSTHYDDGAPIIGDKDPQRMTENEARHSAWLQDLQYTQDVANRFADPSVRSLFDNNIGMLREVIVTGKELEAIGEQIKVADPDKVAELQDRQKALQTRLADITTKEEGTKYSRAYNDLIKTGSVSLINILDETGRAYKTKFGVDNITEEQRKSPEYQSIFEEKSKDETLKDSYKLHKVFGTKVDEEVKRREAFNQQALNTELSAMPAIAGIREELQNVGKLTDDTERLTGIRKVTGMINDVSHKIDMSRQTDLQNEYDDFIGKVLTEAQGRTEPTDADLGYQAGLMQSLTPSKELFTNKIPLLSTNKSDVVDDLLSWDMIKQVKAVASSGFADAKASRDLIKELQDKVKRNIQVTKAGLFLNDPAVKQHISKSDILLSENQDYIHEHVLNVLAGQLNHLAFVNEELHHNVADKYSLQHIEKTKRALNEFVPLLKDLVPGYADQVKAIPDIPDAWMELSYSLTDADRKKVTEANKAIVNLKSAIFDARKGLMESGDSLSGFINNLVENHKPTSIDQTYNNLQPYNNKVNKTSLDALFQLKKDDDFLTKKGEVDLGYLYAINTLIESVGVQSRSLELSRLKATREGMVISDPHMQAAENLAFSFMTNDSGYAHSILQKVMDAERTYLKKAGVSTQDIDDAQQNYIKNAIFIGGDSGTAKSTRFLKGLYDLHRYYEGDPAKFAKNVVVLGVSEGNMKILHEGLNDIKYDNFRLADVLKDPALLEKVKGADHIIIDEAQRLENKDIQLLKGYFSGSVPIVFLGDVRQGQDRIATAGVKSIPFTERKSKNNPLVDVAHDVFRGVGNVMPAGWVNEAGEGLRYFKTVADVIDGFYADKSEDKALLTDSVGYESLSPDQRDKAFVLDRELLDTEDLPQSIRGSQFSHVYVALDRNGNDADYYTATGRAKDFLGLPDKDADNLNKLRKEDVAWIDTPLSEPTELLAGLRDKEISRLQSVTGDKAEPVKINTPSEQRSDPDIILPVTTQPTTGDIFKIVGDGEGKGKYVKIVSSDPDNPFIKVVRGKTIAELVNIDVNYPDIETENVDITDLSYLDAEHQKKYTLDELPEIPEKPFINREYTISGNSYAYTHYSFGTSPEEHTAKTAVTQTLDSMRDQYFTPELTYHRSQDMRDENGDPVTKDDVLAVRFTFKPELKPEDKAKFLADFKAATKLSETQLAEIEKSVNEAGELPDKYRYLMVLDPPSENLNTQHANRLQSFIDRGKASGEDMTVLASDIPLAGADEHSNYLVTTKNDQGKKNAIPLKDFIPKVSGKVTLDKSLRAIKVKEFGNWRQKLVLFYDPIKVNEGSNYAILRTLSLDELKDHLVMKKASDVLKAWKDSDYYLRLMGAKLKADPKFNNTVAIYQNMMESTYLFNFIRNNAAQYRKGKAQIKGTFKDAEGKNQDDKKIYAGILDKYGKWDGSKYRLKNKTPEGYRALFDSLIQFADTEGKDKYSDLEMPFDREIPIDYLQKNDNIDFYKVYGEDLHPHTYVNIRDIALEGEAPQSEPQAPIAPEPVKPETKVPEGEISESQRVENTRRDTSKELAEGQPVKTSTIDYDTADKNKYRPGQQLKYNQGIGYEPVRIVANEEVIQALQIASQGDRAMSGKGTHPPVETKEWANNIAKKYGFESMYDLHTYAKEQAKLVRDKNVEKILIIEPNYKESEKPVVAQPAEPEKPKFTIRQGSGMRQVIDRKTKKPKMIPQRLLEVVDQEGNIIEGRKRNEIIRNYKDNYNYDQGQKSSESGIEPSPDQSMVDYIATNSENPAEILTTMAGLSRYTPENQLDPKELAIAKHIGTVQQAAYEGITGLHDKDIIPGVKRMYLRKNGEPIDLIAQKASMQYKESPDASEEVTTQDVVDFMNKYPYKEQFYRQQNPDYYELQNKFTQLTGFDPDKKVIDRFSPNGSFGGMPETGNVEQVLTHYTDEEGNFNIEAIKEEISNDPDHFKKWPWYLNNEQFEAFKEIVYGNNEQEKADLAGEGGDVRPAEGEPPAQGGSEAKTETSRASDTRRNSVDQVESWFKANAHPSVWKDISDDLQKRGVGFLNVDGRYLFGMMQAGKIKLELQRDGIVYTSPKHEFFHLVYNHMLDEPSKQIIMAEAKTAMKRYSPDWRGKKVTDLQAEEWIARYMGKTGTDKPFEGKSPWYTPKGIFQLFMDLVDRMFGRYQGNLKNIDNLLYQIDHGRFKDQMPDLGKETSRNEVVNNSVNKIIDSIDPLSEPLKAIGGNGYYDLFLDRYFKAQGQKGSVIRLAREDKQLKTYSAKDRQEYVENFNKYQDWLRKVADMPKNEALPELEKAGIKNPADFYDNLTDNLFVRNYVGNSFSGGLTLEEIDFYQKELQRLPQDLQDQYAHQILLTNGLLYKQGSAIDIIPKSFYERPNGLNDQIGGFTRYINGLSKNSEEMSRLSGELQSYAENPEGRRTPLGGFESDKTADGQLKSNTSLIPPLNPAIDVISGFYSPVEKALTDIKQEKMTATQWLKQLQSRGVKGDELTYTGLEEMLKANPSQSLSRRGIQDWMRDNRIQVKEIVLGGKFSEERARKRENEEKRIKDEIESKGYEVRLEEGQMMDQTLEFNLYNKDGKKVYNDNMPPDISILMYDLQEIYTMPSLPDEHKFSSYQLPGHRENYKEVLIMLPNKKGSGYFTEQGDDGKFRIRKPDGTLTSKVWDSFESAEKYRESSTKSLRTEFQSGHFDEPNTLAHLRMNTRTDAEGKKTLFIEEIQSDWAQKGKKEGFFRSGLETKLPSEFIIEPPSKFRDYWSITEPKGYEGNTFAVEVGQGSTKDEAIRNTLEMRNRSINSHLTSPAPFVTETANWVKLSLKTALKQAVAQSAEKLSWTTGEEQNDRYDLSKQVDKIYYQKNVDGTYKVSAIVKNVGNPLGDNITESKLSEIVGKDVANKIINNEGQAENLAANNEPKKMWNSLSGIDLKVGGKGMIGFYGSPSEGKLGIVGQVAESMWGKGSVKTTEIKINDRVDKSQKFDNHLDLLRAEKQLQSDKNVTAVFEFTDADGKNGLEWKELVGSKQHSIDITPKMREEVSQGLPLFSKPLDFKGVEDQRMTQKSAEILFDKIQSQFPQLNFIKEDSASLSAKGVNGSLRGYDDSEGTHYNLDRLTKDTWIHEPQHIWNKVYKIREPEKYAKIENSVKQSIATPGTDIARLSEEIGLKYPELNKAQHLDEVMATIGGFTSIPAVERFLAESESKIPENDKGFAQRIYDSVKRFVTDLWNGIKDALGLSAGFKIDSDLNKFYKDFTDQVFHGDKFKFSPEELQTINSMGKTEQRPDRQPIEDIIDIVPYSKSEYTNPLKYTKMDSDQITDEIFKEVKAQGVNDAGEYFYVNEGRHNKWKADTHPDTGLKNAIRREVTPQYLSIDEKTNNLVSRYIDFTHTPLSASADQVTKGQTLRDISDAVFGTGHFTDRVLRQFSLQLGLDYAPQQAIRYSRLTASDDPLVRGLFKEGLTGYDPIVVIYGFDENGVADVSLFDVTAKGLGGKVGDPGEANIFDNFINSKQYKKLGGPEGWNNKEYSYRKLLLSMQALSMDKAQFRNLSVLQIGKDNVTPYNIEDIREPQKILDILKGQKEFMDNVSNGSISGIINSVRTTPKKFSVPFVDRLNKMLSEQAELLNPKQESNASARSIEAQSNALLNPNTSTQDVVKVLEKMMRDKIQSTPNKDELWSDPEFILISQSIDDIKYPGMGMLSKTEDMKFMAKYLTMPANSPVHVAQRVGLSIQTTTDEILDRYNTYHEKVMPLLEKTASWWRGQHPGEALKAFGKDMGHLYWNDMRKDITVTAGKDLKYDGKDYKKGEEVRVKSPFFHVDPKDTETASLIARGKLTQDHIDLANLIIGEVKERTIDDIYWKQLLEHTEQNTDDLGNPLYTRKEAEQKFNDMYPKEKGFLPTIERSVSDLLTSGEKKGVTKLFGTIRSSEEFFSDLVRSDKGKDAVWNSFSEQMTNPSKAYEKMGMRLIKEGLNTRIELVSPEDNTGSSGNIERIGNYFMLKSIRDEAIQNHFIPVYNMAMSILSGWEIANDSKLPHAKDFIQQLTDRFVKRENIDERMKADWHIGNVNVPIGSLVRGLTSFTTMGIIGFRMITAVKVGIANEFNATVNAISNSLADIGIPKEQRDKMLPDAGDHMMALSKFSPDNAHKIFQLGRMLHFWNQSERAFLQAPSKNVALRRNSFQQTTAMIGEATVDQGARMHSMVAMMLHNGAWEAYSYDPKSRLPKWDRFKDKRYFNPDKSQSPEQRTLYDALILRLKDQGLMKPDETIPTRGDDYDIMENQYQWYSNQFVYIGTTDGAKTLIGNGFWGAMMAQFRTFTQPRLRNLGLFGKNMKSIGGGSWKAVKDEDGKMIPEFEQREMEGQYQSWSSALQDLWNVKNMKASEISFPDWWKAQPQARRANLARSMLYAGALAGIAYLATSLSKKDEQRYAYLWSELLMGYAAEGWMKSPVPMISQTLNLTQVALGQKNFNTLINMAGPPGGISRTRKLLRLD
jgi:hypothetical protein